MLRLLIADDHPVFRGGLVTTFSEIPSVHVVGQVADGELALAQARTMRPDVLLLDVNMPKLNGQQVAQAIAAEKLNVRVVMLTAHNDETQEMLAARQGCAGYCAKDVTPNQLVAVVNHVAAGQYYFGQRFLSAEGVRTWLEQKEDNRWTASDDGRVSPLTRREMEILLQVTRGLANKQIARELSISHQTVKNHLTAILKKLNVEDRTQAAMYAVKQGWVRLDDPNLVPSAFDDDD